MRHELTAALARHHVTAARRSDMELVFTEAANNAVVHAYRRCAPGPLYAAASIADEAVIVLMGLCEILHVMLREFEARFQKGDNPGAWERIG